MAVSASASSIAACSSATSAPVSASMSPDTPRRSSQAMSISPAANSGRSRIASRKARLVVPSSIIVVDSRSARLRRAMASGRVRP